MISIIIPVYNVAPYIGACLDSIISQHGFDKFEVIVVDDGSTDNTAHFVQRYATNYPNIRLYTQKNLGVSVARNRGMYRARGRYISFVDGDDAVGGKLEIPVAAPKPVAKNLILHHLATDAHPAPLAYDAKYFWRMLHTAKTTNADVVLAGKVTTPKYPGSWSVLTYDPDTVFGTSPQDKCLALSHAYIRESANSALYRTKFIRENDLRFDPKLDMNEDILFCMSAVLDAARVATVGESLYVYKRRLGTLSNIIDIKKQNEHYCVTIIQCMSNILYQLMQRPQYAMAYTTLVKNFAQCADSDYSHLDNLFPPTRCKNCSRDMCLRCRWHNWTLNRIKENVSLFEQQNRTLTH